MKARRWVGPSIVVAFLLANRVIRIVDVAQTDPVEAFQEVGVGVGVLATFAVVALGIFWARSGDRVQRRRALGSVWVDDVKVSPIEALRAPESGSKLPRDFALGIEDGAVKLWATADGDPVLSIAGTSIRSVEVIEIAVPTNVEYSVYVITDHAEISFSPSAVIGLSPPRRDAVLIANRIGDLMPADVRPALFE